METRFGSTSEAVELLIRGEVVALPTETVYGLAADATRPDAVAKIFEAKERPFFDPLIVHLPDLPWLDRLTQNRRPLAEKLAEKFWPGPLTLVLQRREIVPDLATSGLPTVAVRMSAHPVFREICARFGKPLAAPSANRFGRISPTAAAHVMAELGGRIPLIVDGGATEFGVESTIIAVEKNRIKILRSGPVTPEQLAEFGEMVFEKHGKTSNAPGQLESHYAPATPLRIADWLAHPPAPAIPLLLLDGLRKDGMKRRVGLLAWDSSAPLRFAQNDKNENVFAMVEVLSANGDLREAAATLFAKMRRLDEVGLDLIVAEPVPEVGLGVAIMDRLRKAAHGND